VDYRGKRRRINKLGTVATFLSGLGAGVAYSALSLAPETTVSGDKYMRATVLGVVVLIVGSVTNFVVRWKHVRLQKQINLDELNRKIK
jgi:hypothetical protein